MIILSSSYETDLLTYSKYIVQYSVPLYIVHKTAFAKFKDDVFVMSERQQNLIRELHILMIMTITMIIMRLHNLCCDNNQWYITYASFPQSTSFCHSFYCKLYYPQQNIWSCEAPTQSLDEINITFVWSLKTDHSIIREIWKHNPLNYQSKRRSQAMCGNLLWENPMATNIRILEFAYIEAYPVLYVVLMPCISYTLILD